MKPELIRLARMFAVTSRIVDLNTLMGMRTHFANYGKLGETNERALRDMESRYSLGVQQYDNFFFDREKAAVDKYIEITHQEQLDKTKEEVMNVSSSNKEKKAK